MVFGFLVKKLKDRVFSAAKRFDNKINSAYKSVLSTAKSVFTTVKNKYKKEATKVKNNWNRTPIWGKIAIGAVVGAAIGVGLVVMGPAALVASTSAAAATIGMTIAYGGFIGYHLHSETVNATISQPAPQQFYNRRTNEDENTQERNEHLNESDTYRRDYYTDEDLELQRILEQSIPGDQQLNDNNIELARAFSLSEAQPQNEQHDNDLQNAIALSLSGNLNLESTDLRSDVHFNDKLECINSAQSEEQIDFQMAIYKSLQISNSESDYQEAVALNLFTAMKEEEEQESINMEIATHESIISYFEKFEIETKETCTIQKLIESTNTEVIQTIEGLDNEHEAMKLIKEALKDLNEGKIHEQHERISQALRCFTNASQRLDKAASLKRLNIILETAHQVIESLAQIEAYDEVVEFCEKLKSNFPEFAHLFDRIEEQIQNGQWIGNFDDIVNKNEQSGNNVVQLLSAP